ncbi:MAG TPA: hypothetical protein VJC08_01620, partial [bacterium]|nr:hypothetical protein [bacterium]
MTRFRSLALFVLFAALGVASPVFAEEFSDLPPLPKGPLRLTSVVPAQLSADYWIRRMPDADRVLKIPAELKAFNDDIHAMIKDCVDIFKADAVRAGKPVREQMELEYRAVGGRILFGVD